MTDDKNDGPNAKPVAPIARARLRPTVTRSIAKVPDSTITSALHEGLQRLGEELDDDDVAQIADLELPPREATQRRVYVLPTPLVDRIVAYQKANSFASEVEAARYLLDEALKSKETAWDVAEQIYELLRAGTPPQQVIRDTVVGHPRVRSLNFGEEGTEIAFIDGSRYLIRGDRKLYEYNEKHDVWGKFDPIPF